VISLSDSAESSDEVILGSVLIVEGSLSEPVSERVDAEGRLRKKKREKILVRISRRGQSRERGRGERRTNVVNEAQPGGPSEEESSSPISPTETSDDSREKESHRDDEVEVPLREEREKEISEG